MDPERPSPSEPAAPPLTVWYLSGMGARIERRFAHAFRIGRDPVCEFCIQEHFISRTHAAVVYEDGDWWILDRNSTNGTYIDGRAIVRARLAPGTLVQLGVDGVLLSFSYGEMEPVSSSGPEAVFPAAPQETPPSREAQPPEAPEAAPPARLLQDASGASPRRAVDKGRARSVEQPLPVVKLPPPSRRYSTASFSLQIPAGWKDRTDHLLTGPAIDGIQPNITVHRSSVKGTTFLEDFAEEQVNSLRALKDCRILHQRPVMLEIGLQALRVIFCWNPSEDLHLYQEQVYVLHEGTGFTLTASFTRRTRKRYGKAVERTLLSFCPVPAWPS